MSLLKYINRLRQMDALIRRRATGNANEFAHKLGISVSVLKDNINEMRELGAPIDYSRQRKSYCYKTECRLRLDFENVLTTADLTSLRGGQLFDCNRVNKADRALPVRAF